MMKHIFHIVAQNQPAALERLLRVTRHRGFTVTAMTVQTLSPSDHLEISLTVDGERPAHILLYQLTKLAEITAVNIPEMVPK
ncbi:MAG: acetolactate synthase 2 small subunit [Desulfobacterales bacterium]|jgi:acetolactate synthase II small subunit|nr:acetolactate synthase 2 small subunit [Desulfobacterales bacterium]